MANRRRDRQWARALAIIALLGAMLLGAPAPARAVGLNHAEVIVRHGNGGLTYALVAFSEAQLSAVDLLARANLGAVTVEFGGLGSAVCMIEKEGCPPSVCQQKVCQNGSADSPFWHFFRMSAAGDWQLAPLGASSVRVHDGDVTGWSWTGNDSGLPAASFAQLESEAAQAGRTAGNGEPTIWHVGPLSASDDRARQSWFVYAGAGIIFAGALGALVLVLTRRRRLSGASFDELV